MNLANRSLITVDDLSNAEILAVFALADEMLNSMSKQSSVCQGKVMASLFFEPSTRTRFSFEAAMARLGGRVISTVDVDSTSLSKGESLADMARVVGSYADIIVIRHPWEGAAKVLADYAGVPVINAGDGGHEHPTQTLCDLYALKKERQTIKGQHIALWGDLKYGRTVHSLAYALARFGATMLFCPAPGFEMPEHVLRKLTQEYGVELSKSEPLDPEAKEGLFALDAIYVTPSKPHQLAMMPDIHIQLKLPAELRKGVDALYVTRLQRERLVSTSEEQDSKKAYPVVDGKLLKGREFRETLVMHPLPRVSELAREIDADPRSMYFKQAAWGVPARMALISLLLGAKDIDVPVTEEPPFVRKMDYPLYDRGFGVRCQNPRCVSVQEKEYTRPEFSIVDREPLRLRCVYCEHETLPKYIASSDWHEGRAETKRYHSSSSHWIRQIRPENLLIFDSEEEAHSCGFKPGKYAAR